MNPTLLLILDGWGIGKADAANAIHIANPSYFNYLLQTYPHSYLDTSGEAVGLPAGQMGNSEVGHLNIGAGRVVYQELEKINEAIKTKAFFQNPALLKAIHTAKQTNTTFHILGLLSDGGVHSSIHHLYAIIDACKHHGLQKVAIHAFLDGRDTNPTNGITYVKELLHYLQGSNIVLASIIGRYYAMDRDKRWERINKAYQLLINADGKKTTNPIQALQDSYEDGITDEFMLPISINPIPIQDEDTVLCFNFRTDRGRQITEALTQQDFPEYNMYKKKLHYYTLTNYNTIWKNVTCLYDKENLINTLGEVLNKHGASQMRIAETEKYPHVTFFLSGGREAIFPNEERILIPSPKVATYDLAPEMSANEIKEATIQSLQKKYDCIIVNFANPDMVGHTGDFDAVVKAIQTVDTCLQEVVKEATTQGYTILVIADHGNAEYMKNQDGSPHTAHTTNVVPIILLSPQHTPIKNGKLANIAPTILKIMGIEKPTEMTEEALI